MKKIKVSEATPLQLDYLVAKAEGFWFGDAGHCQYALYQPHKYGPSMPREHWKPSTIWSQGGPIIERERISIEIKHDGWWLAQIYNINDDPRWLVVADTPLIAAMRCYVASKLGEEVEIPEERL